MSGHRVLVVDDEPQIVRALSVMLANAGFAVDSAATVAEARVALVERPPDAVVLDLVLPDGYGIDVCREVRAGSALPVLVLSAVGDEREKVRALDAGADDYVTKPFGAGELTARLRALLRRTGDDRAAVNVVEAADVRIDLDARRVTKADEEVRLTPIEFDLLAALARQHGKLVTQRQLLAEVWGPGHEDHTHYLRVHVAHIRAKLETDPSAPRVLTTDPGVGYRLAA